MPSMTRGRRLCVRSSVTCCSKCSCTVPSRRRMTADSTSVMLPRWPAPRFGDVAVDGAAEVVVNWEKLKRSENHPRLSLLDGVPHALPALAFAQGVQKRPARVGFDETPSVQSALERVHDALGDVQSMAASVTAENAQGQDWTQSPQRHEDAIGELLFAVVALARRLRVNPEDSLRRRSTAFAERFRTLESQARADGVDLHDLDIAEWRRRWRAT